MGYLGRQPTKSYAISTESITIATGQAVYTISNRVPSSASIILVYDGAIKKPVTDFVISNGTTLTLNGTITPTTGKDCYIYYLERA